MSGTQVRYFVQSSTSSIATSFFFCHSPGYKQLENSAFNYISENENILFVPVESVKD